MVDFLQEWNRINNGSVEYWEPEESYSDCTVYITEDKVFKQSTDRFQDRLWKSKSIIQLLHSQGVNVPEVLFSSRIHNLVVYERIHGQTISNLSQPKYSRNIGIELSKIHKMNCENFGEVLFVEEQKPTAYFHTLSAYVETAVEKLDNYIPENSVYRDLFTEIEKHIHKVDRVKQNSTICHADLDMKNIICTNEKSYLIDFMGSELSVPSIDVVRFYLKMKRNGKSDEFMSGFLEGYGKQITDLPQFGIILATLTEISRSVYWEKNKKEINRFDFERYKNIIQNFGQEYIDTYQN